MKKIKIGIPRTFLYYRYNVIWKQFFELLGAKIILSPESDELILKLGQNNTLTEYCLPYKIYIGHILYLKESCDYILISKICNYGSKEKTCPILNDTYDNIKEILNKNQILSYNIEHTKYKYEFIEFIKMGLKITKNIPKIILSYLIAKKKQKNHQISKENEQKNNITKQNLKILVISNFYNIRDKYLSSPIIEFLKSKDITIIYSDMLSKKIARKFSEYISPTPPLVFTKELIGSLYYYKYMVDGIIFISNYPCIIDSKINNILIRKNQDIPSLNLIISEDKSHYNIKKELDIFIKNIRFNK